MLNNLALTDNGVKKILEITQSPKMYSLLSHLGDFWEIDYSIENPYHGHIFNIGVMGDSFNTIDLKEDNKILILPSHAESDETILYPYVVWKSPADIVKGDKAVIPRLDNPKQNKSSIFNLPRLLSFFANKFQFTNRQHNVEFSSDYFRFMGYYFGSASVFPNYNSIIFNTNSQNNYCVSDMEKLIKKYLSFKKNDIRTLRGKKKATIIAPFSSPKVTSFLYKYNANEFSHLSSDMLKHFDLELSKEFLKGFVWSQAGSEVAKGQHSKRDGEPLIGYLPTKLYGDSMSSLLTVQWMLSHFDIYCILKKNEKYLDRWNTGEKPYYLKIMSYSVEAFSELIEIEFDPEILKNPYPYSPLEKPISDERYIYMPITKVSYIGKVSTVDYELFSENKNLVDDGVLLNQLIVR